MPICKGKGDIKEEHCLAVSPPPLHKNERWLTLNKRKQESGSLLMAVVKAYGNPLSNYLFFSWEIWRFHNGEKGLRQSFQRVAGDWVRG